jgi:hypothetical protein
MKQLIAVTMMILLGSASMAFATLTDVNQAGPSVDGYIINGGVAGGTPPCKCQQTGFKNDTTKGHLQTAEEVRAASHDNLITAEGAALVPKGMAPASGAE